MEPEEQPPGEERPVIEVTKNGPYIVRNLKNFRNSKGVFIRSQPVMALCRCGGSSNKPFCDGIHVKIGFSAGKHEDRVPDRLDTYEGGHITIHDNRGVCSHVGHCTDNLPTVFRMEIEPWIDPGGAEPEEIARVIRMCPSGALSYSKDGILYKDWENQQEIFIAHNRPYHVSGIELRDPDGNTPETPDHYTLCRCGGSKNKPFCDGTHWNIKFEDEKN
jgi:CDGSH-type Zn-finger protein